MANRLKLGLVGAGPVVERFHLPAIRGVPEIIPWIVADVDPQRLELLAGRGSFRETTIDYRELIGKVDLAVVAVPNSLHAPVSSQLVEAGVHVLCEKPLARTVAECQSMLNASALGNSLLAAGHNRRFRQNVRDAKSLIDGGVIGRVVRIDAEEGSPSDWPRSKAYFDPKVAGGGALLDVGIHSIDLVRFLLGEFESVQYTGNNTPAEVESDATIDFGLACGTTGRIRSSRTQRLRNEMVFHGTDGVLSMSLWGNSLALGKKSGKAFREFPRLRSTLR